MAKKKEKIKTGRKNAYDSIIKPNFHLIEAWCRNGMIEKDMYQNLGISEDCWYKYKRLKEEFAKLLRESKEVVDNRVEAALLKKALGFTDEEGKVHPPDTTAMIFWLKNRRRKSWKDKVEQEVSHKGELNITWEEIKNYEKDGDEDE